MPFEPDMYDLMPVTVTIHPYVSEDSYGKRTYGPTRTTRARVQNLVKSWHWKKGDEVQSKSMVYLADAAMTDKDRLEIPGHNPPMPPFIEFNRQDDEFGYHHTEIYI